MANEFQNLEDILTNMKTTIATIDDELSGKLGQLPDGAISAADVATFKADFQATADNLKSLATLNAPPVINS